MPCYVLIYRFFIMVRRSLFETEPFYSVLLPAVHVGLFLPLKTRHRAIITTLSTFCNTSDPI